MSFSLGHGGMSERHFQLGLCTFPRSFCFPSHDQSPWPDQMVQTRLECAPEISNRYQTPPLPPRFLLPSSTLGLIHLELQDGIGGSQEKIYRPASQGNCQCLAINIFRRDKNSHSLAEGPAHTAPRSREMEPRRECGHSSPTPQPLHSLGS